MTTKQDIRENGIDWLVDEIDRLKTELEWAKRLEYETKNLRNINNQLNETNNNLQKEYDILEEDYRAKCKDYIELEQLRPMPRTPAKMLGIEVPMPIGNYMSAEYVRHLLYCLSWFNKQLDAVQADIDLPGVIDELYELIKQARGMRSHYEDILAESAKNQATAFPGLDALLNANMQFTSTTDKDGNVTWTITF